MDLVVEIYKITENYPKSEMYGLVSQTRRSAVSIPSNIAEGRRLGSRKDFRQFLIAAFGSGAELETQIQIVKRLLWSRNINFEKADSLLNEVMKMLNKMIFSLQATN